MKKLISIFNLCSSFIVFSQEVSVASIEYYSANTIDNNTYYKDVTGVLDKFTGVWVYSDNTHYLKVQFYKAVAAPYDAMPTIFIDELRSFIQYKIFENGQWVMKYNTIRTLPGQVNPSDYLDAIRGSLIWHGDDNTLNLQYNEPTTSCVRLKDAELILTHTVDNNGVEQLQWVRKPLNDNWYAREFPCTDGTQVDTSDFIIPANLVLTKEE